MAGGDWSSTPHPGPCTHLLLDIRQRLDGQIGKGREALVGRGSGSVLGGDPNLEPRSLILKEGLPQYLPEHPLVLPATASCHQYPAVPPDSPFWD